MEKSKERRMNKKNSKKSMESPYTLQKKVQSLFGCKFTCENNLDFPRYQKEEEWLTFDPIEIAEDAIDNRINRIESILEAYALETDSDGISKQICLFGSSGKSDHLQMAQYIHLPQKEEH